MSFLLDTSILSETMRPSPNRAVSAWLASVPDESLHVSVLSLGELRQGVARLPRGPKRQRLEVWLEQSLPSWFEGRLLGVDAAIADRWGRLRARAGRPLPAIDALLAATALSRGLRMVTRNVADFAFEGLEVIDPWSA